MTNPNTIRSELPDHGSGALLPFWIPDRQGVSPPFGYVGSPVTTS